MEGTGDSLVANAYLPCKHNAPSWNLVLLPKLSAILEALFLGSVSHAFEAPGQQAISLCTTARVCAQLEGMSPAESHNWNKKMVRLYSGAWNLATLHSGEHVDVCGPWEHNYQVCVCVCYYQSNTARTEGRDSKSRSTGASLWQPLVWHLLLAATHQCAQGGTMWAGSERTPSGALELYMVPGIELSSNQPPSLLHSLLGPGSLVLDVWLFNQDLLFILSPSHILTGCFLLPFSALALFLPSKEICFFLQQLC